MDPGMEVPIIKKKRQKAEVSRVAPLEYPPCTVCGGKGSGKHYGVYTCQSCKTFYRRYLKRDKPYVCARNGKCAMVSSSRSNCSACRIDKCKQVGMSVDGVKIGRCTLEERNKTIIAVNQFESRSRSQKLRLEQLRIEITQRFQKVRQEFPVGKGVLVPCGKKDIQAGDGTFCIHCSDKENGELSSQTVEHPCSVQYNTNRPDDLITRVVKESLADTACAVSNLTLSGDDRLCSQSGVRGTGQPDVESSTSIQVSPRSESDRSTFSGKSGTASQSGESGAYSESGLDGTLTVGGTCSEASLMANPDGTYPTCPQNASDSFCDLEYYQVNATQANLSSDLEHQESDILKDIIEECQDGLQDSASGSFETMCPLSPGSLEECFRELMEWTEQEGDRVNSDNMELRENAVQELVNTFREVSIHPHLTDEEIKAKLREEHERNQAFTQLLGPMTPMSRDEYLLFFKETGLDIDGRMAFYSTVSSRLSKYIRRIVKFAHKIPGFRTLPAEDQASLIRVARSEFHILTAQRAVDPDLEVCMMPTGDVFHISKLWFPPEAKRLGFHISKAIQNLHLTGEEMALCLGITLTFTDRCHLQKKEVVDRINMMLINSLQELLQKRLHSQASIHFCKIMDVFIQLRTLTNERDAFHKSALKDDFVRKYCSNFTVLQIHPND